MLAADPTGQVVGIYLQATDLTGTPIERVVSGESFLIKVYVEDRRGEADVQVPPPHEGSSGVSPLPKGVFEAYTNITYSSHGFDFDPDYPLTAGPNAFPLNNRIWGDGSIDGLLAEAGFTDFNPSSALRPDPVEMFSFRMIAEAPGIYTADNGGFSPYFHFYEVATYQGPGGTEVPIYDANGVPVMERLTGTAYNNSINEGTILLLEYDIADPRLTQDWQVYFRGVDIEVLPANLPADFEIRVVTTPTPVNQGEVTSLPNNLQYIDEWDNVYVEVYGRAPAGYAIQNAVVTINFDPAHYEFSTAIGRGQDSQLRYSVSFTEDNSASGQVTVGFSSPFENVGDDKYGLIGRIQLSSLREVPHSGPNGNIQPVVSSPIGLEHASPTLTRTLDSVKLISSSDSATPVTFDVWPVMYDVDDSGQVALSDFVGFVSSFGTSVGDPNFDRRFDYDRNGSISLFDFSLFVANFGQSRSAGGTRQYHSSFPQAFQSPALMGSTFLLEGESIDTTSPISEGLLLSPPQPAVVEEPVASTAVGQYWPQMTIPGDPTSPTLQSATTVATASAVDHLAVLPHWSEGLSGDETAQLFDLSANSLEDFSDSTTQSTYSVEIADEVLARWEDDFDLSY